MIAFSSVAVPHGFAVGLSPSPALLSVSSVLPLFPGGHLNMLRRPFCVASVISQTKKRTHSRRPCIVLQAGVLNECVKSSLLMDARASCICVSCHGAHNIIVMCVSAHGCACLTAQSLSAAPQRGLCLPSDAQRGVSSRRGESSLSSRRQRGNRCCSRMS